MNRLDLAYLGRDSRPIPVSSCAEIERRASWGAFVEDMKLVGAVIATAAVVVAAVALWGVIV